MKTQDGRKYSLGKASKEHEEIEIIPIQPETVVPIKQEEEQFEFEERGITCKNCFCPETYSDHPSLYSVEPINQKFPSLTTEVNRLIEIIYKDIRPKQVVHDIILLPILVSICIVMFFVDLNESKNYCDSSTWYIQNCENYLNQVPYGAFISSNVTILRFLTYTIHHDNWLHISSNMILLTISLYFMERKYGALRMTVLYLLSSIGSALVFWLFDPTSETVGISGPIYAFMFLYLGDVTANWRTVYLPRTEICLVIAGIISFFIDEYLNVGVAVFSHVGGALTGIWFSLLILPRFFHEKYDWILHVVAVIILLLQYLAIPLYKIYS